MQNNRHAILSLVALGRITPAEAERLLIAWNDGREEIWIVMVCFAAVLTEQLHPGLWQSLLHGIPALGQGAHGIAGGRFFSDAGSMLGRILGGML